ncbi:MAG: NAD(P)/FAD-dependent oxidoreductase [Bacillota bacterium]|nr:NAD(P)/FAD-dependent oxidoreductase [Bacillota bacterium]
MKDMKYKVCIIGGGAAGLTAAASFCKSDLDKFDYTDKICLLEKSSSVGRKILATGGGRCNLTNMRCENKEETIEFFRSLGLETWCDNEGRYYPYSGKASDVLKTLENAIDDRVEISCGMEVKSVRPLFDNAKAEKNGFEILAIEKGKKERLIRAQNVVFALGGKAAPQFGTTGDGYAMARKLGHRVSKVFPILTGICCEREGVDFRKLKGIRARGQVRLYKKGVPVKIDLSSETDQRYGEIQFTEDGLSGICIFDLTRYITVDAGETVREAMSNYSLSVDFAPDFSRQELEGRKNSFGILTEKLAEFVPVDQLKDWQLQVTGVKGWKEAQATSGGVLLEDIDLSTMESKLVKGLYFAGEVLDIQGPCGGFNLQNAWETGLKAATSIMKG